MSTSNDCSDNDEKNVAISIFLSLNAEAQQDIIDLLRCLALTE